MLDELDLWIDGQPRSAAAQMAADEAAFRFAKRPLLRVYRWSAPALSFGYPQALRDIEPLAPGRDVVRRWTGGGVVFHGDDLTLALALPGPRGAGGRRACEIYSGVHAAIARLLEAGGTAADLVGSGRCEGGLECFRAPVTNDLVQGGQKILGGAIRRTRDGLLYQGSLQGVVLPAPDDVASALCGQWTQFEPPPELERETARLTAAKYATREWTSAR